MSKKSRDLRRLERNNLQRRIQPMADPPRPQVVQQQETLYKGPIPPPAMLEHFERVHSGLADRIVRLTERSMDYQDKALTIAGRDRVIGQISSLILTLATLGCGTFLIYHDKPLTGLAALLTGIGVIVGSILREAQKQKRKDAAKA